jgi:two-component system sensor histidine kinase DesK
MSDARINTNAPAASQGEVQAEQTVLDERHLVWRRLNLVYLVFVFLPLIWQREQLLLSLGASILAVAVFLPLYWKSFDLSGRKALLTAAAIVALGYALTPWNPGGNSFLIYAFATMGFTQPWRRAVVFAVIAIVGYALLMAALAAPMEFLIAPVLIGGIVLLGAVLGRREMERNAKLQLTQAEVDRLARLAERERIARDLHDLLGHTLSVIAMKSELARKLAERDGSASATHMGEVENVAREALKQVREAVSGMRSAQLAAELANARLVLLSAGVRLDVRIDPLPSLEAAQENALAMAVREAITNVVRHANAERVEIDLVREGRSLRLDVQDNGRGCTTPASGGLLGMRERLAELGGEVRMDSAPGVGTRLRVLLPLDAPASRR